MTIMKKFNIKFTKGQLDRTYFAENKEGVEIYFKKKYPNREILLIEEREG